MVLVVNHGPLSPVHASSCSVTRWGRTISQLGILSRWLSVALLNPLSRCPCRVHGACREATCNTKFCAHAYMQGGRPRAGRRAGSCGRARSAGSAPSRARSASRRRSLSAPRPRRSRSCPGCALSTTAWRPSSGCGLLSGLGGAPAMSHRGRLHHWGVHRSVHHSTRAGFYKGGMVLATWVVSTPRSGAGRGAADAGGGGQAGGPVVHHAAAPAPPRLRGRIPP